MKTQLTPNAEIVFKRFQPISELVRNGLIFGCDQSVQLLGSIGVKENLDPWLYSHIARFQTRRWFDTQGISNWGFVVQDVPFSGLWLRSADLDVRILKIDHRPDPVTKESRRRIQVQNVSEARKAYYLQPQLDLTLFAPDGTSNKRRIKLLVLWDNDAFYQLGTLDWACPKFLDEDKQTVETHWWLPFPKEGVADFRQSTDLPLETVQLSDVEILTDGQDAAKATGQ